MAALFQNRLAGRVLFVLLLALSPVVHAGPTTFWVSPTGSDASAGTQAEPFRTIDRARRAVRAAIERQVVRTEITVYIQDGTYRLDQSLVFDYLDSGSNGADVVYRAAPGQNPVISGSIPVPNNSWSVFNAGLNIWRAYVGPHQSRQLYVNGVRATRAQTELIGGTNFPAGFLPYAVVPAVVPGVPFVVGGGIGYIPTNLNPAGWRDPTTWTNVSDIEAVVATQWKMMSVPVDSIIPFPGYTPDPLNPALQTGLIVMQQPGWTNANVFYDDATGKPGIWSFWQVTRFENALEFVDQPGEWYLDKTAGWLYYIPRPGEDLATTAQVELPIVEILVDGQGQMRRPVTNIRFEGLTFSHATWLAPSAGDGYVSDQSGFHLIGPNHYPNIIGHDQVDVRSQGNVRFKYANGITFRGNIFEHLGGVALDFDTGSQSIVIEDNLFTDISSAAIQLGGIGPDDHHPSAPMQVTCDNIISNNLIRQTGREFVDSAGIYIGFNRNTVIKNNTIVDVPWAGIAMGWGWGLLDPGSFLGLDGATLNEWGIYTTPTPNSSNKILNNRIYSFLNVLWDGGAIYTTGQQGTSMGNGLLISGNVASDKLVNGGGNTFYTDGGSRYVTLTGNVSYSNPIGNTNFGPNPLAGDPLPYGYVPPLPYGGDTGGCRTYGDIDYNSNYWQEGSIPADEGVYNIIYTLIPLFGFGPYSPEGFFDVCPYTAGGVPYPTNMNFAPTNVTISGPADIPASILSAAGVRSRPENIPASKWILPP